MDEVLKALLDSISGGGYVAIWIAIGWFTHKIAIVAIVSWSAVRLVNKISDLLLAKIQRNVLMEQIAHAAGFETPLSEQEISDIKSRLLEGRRKDA